MIPDLRSSIKDQARQARQGLNFRYTKFRKQAIRYQDDANYKTAKPMNRKNRKNRNLKNRPKPDDMDRFPAWIAPGDYEAAMKEVEGWRKN